MALRDIDYVISKMQWMEAQGIWPNGLRYLWTDAFGLVLYLSLYEHTGDKVFRDRGVIWKMLEDLSAPYPGHGLGAMDAYDGYVMYRLLDPELLAGEIAQMSALMNASYPSLSIDQDLGLGMMLWLSHFFPAERWAVQHRARSLLQLNGLWIDPPGYFCRQTGWRNMKFAFTNYGISLGLQAVGQWPQRVYDLNNFFDRYESGDEYDRNAITHVMACTSHFPGLFLQSDTAQSAAHRA